MGRIFGRTLSNPVSRVNGTGPKHRRAIVPVPRKAPRLKGYVLKNGHNPGHFRMIEVAVSASTAQGSSAEILLPCGVGELIDKITILEIKAAHFRNETQLANVRYELALLRKLKIEHGFVGAEFDRLETELQKTNAALWNIEDALRLLEDRQEFGAAFVDYARSVYKTNDRRAALKKEINLLCKSTIVEEKSYASFAPVASKSA